MMDKLNKKHLYLSVSISFTLFIILNFILDPSYVFGLVKFIQNKTGYFFGVDINTLDYFFISLIPIFGLLLNSRRKENSFAEIIKDNFTISISCILTFSIGLLILISKIGSPGENPRIPEYLRVEPFKIYSTFFIIAGIILPFFLIKNKLKNVENEIEEIKS